MNREDVIRILLAHESQLRAEGVRTLSLFGSVARDEAGPDSDIDVAVRVDGSFARGGFDYFGRLEQLEAQLSTLLGRHVDVVEEPVKKQRFQNEIDRDRALAF